jgi:hypothetical protein
MLTPYKTLDFLGPFPFQDGPEEYGENRKQQKYDPRNEARGNINVRVRHVNREEQEVIANDDIEPLNEQQSQLEHYIGIYAK